MRILTNENDVYEMNNLPEEVGELNYCVLDYSDQADVDFYFVPMLFMDTFRSPAALLQIGPYQVQIPLDWSLIIGDKHLGDLEILEIIKINDREFDAFTFNPISSYIPNFQQITILDIFPDIKWHFPKLKFGHILPIPLGEKKQWPMTKGPEPKLSPECFYIVKDINKLPDSLDIGKVIV